MKNSQPTDFPDIIVKVIKALDNPIRRRILMEVQDTEGLTTSQLEKATGLKYNMGLRKHVYVLQAAAMLESRMGKDASFENMTYRITSIGEDAVDGLFLAFAPRFGKPQNKEILADGLDRYAGVLAKFDTLSKENQKKIVADVGRDIQITAAGLRLEALDEKRKSESPDTAAQMKAVNSVIRGVRKNMASIEKGNEASTLKQLDVFTTGDRDNFLKGAGWVVDFLEAGLIGTGEGRQTKQ